MSEDDNIHQSQIVKELGGYNDTITDMFGVDHNICDLDDGLDRVLRRSILRHAVIAHRQPHWLPAFTQVVQWDIRVLTIRLLNRGVGKIVSALMRHVSQLIKSLIFRQVSSWIQFLITFLGC